MSRAPTRNIISTFFLIVISLAGLIFPAIADEDNEPIGEIIVSAEPISGETIPDKPTSFSEIIELDEENRQFIELKELLSDKVGIHVRSFGGPGSSSTVNIRGVSSKGILVMIDDVPLNGLGSTGVDLSSLPLSGFEKIEILRGGGGAFYGDSALGGVVNLITSDTKDSYNHSSFSVGSFGLLGTKSLFTGRRGNEKFLLAIESVGAKGDFTFLNDNGTTLDKSDDFTDKRKNNESESYGALFKSSVEMSDKARFSFVGEFFNSRKGVPGLVTFPTPSARQIDKRVFVQSIFENDDVFPRTTVAFRIFFRHDLLDYEEKLGQATGTPIDTHRVDNLFGIASEFFRIDSDGFGSITSGFEISDERYIMKDENSLGRSKSAFSIQKERAFDDGSWILHGAARIDAIEGFAIRPTFRVGASRLQSTKSEFRANIGNSFRIPGFDELYEERGFIVGNRNLVPEKGYDLDLGWIFRDKKSSFTISFFHNRLRDQVVYELTSGHRFKPFNVGKSNISGIEITAERQLDDLTISGNYTWLDARNKSDELLHFNKQLPSRPEHELYVNMLYDRKPFVFDFDVDYTSGNYVTFANTTRLKDRFRADFRMTYDRDNWSLTGEVRNLFNNNLVDIRGLPLPGRYYVITFSRDW